MKEICYNKMTLKINDAHDDDGLLHGGHYGDDLHGDLHDDLHDDDLCDGCGDDFRDECWDCTLCYQILD